MQLTPWAPLHHPEPPGTPPLTRQDPSAQEPHLSDSRNPNDRLLSVICCCGGVGEGVDCGGDLGAGYFAATEMRCSLAMRTRLPYRGCVTVLTLRPLFHMEHLAPTAVALQEFRTVLSELSAVRAGEAVRTNRDRNGEDDHHGTVEKRTRAAILQLRGWRHYFRTQRLALSSANLRGNAVRFHLCQLLSIADAFHRRLSMPAVAACVEMHWHRLLLHTPRLGKPFAYLGQIHRGNACESLSLKTIRHKAS